MYTWIEGLSALWITTGHCEYRRRKLGGYQCRLQGYVACSVWRKVA
jgi:hypothetical protein